MSDNEFCQEVFFHRLRPRQMVSRRDACSIAWLPIGTLEWHGHHLPLGTDPLQSEHMAKLCAQRGGGVAFPPLYYGEPRLTDHMDCNCPEVAAELKVDRANFEDDWRWPCSPAEEIAAYNQILIRSLAMIQSYGFELAVIVVGHYPLIDHARAAVLHFLHHNRGQWRGRQHESFRPMQAYACVDYLLVEDQYNHPTGDHAGGWETSHMLDSHPELCDLASLPEKDTDLIGCGGFISPRDASAAFGKQTMDAAVEQAIAEANDRLAFPQDYHRNGHSQREGLWQQRHGHE